MQYEISDGKAKKKGFALKFLCEKLSIFIVLSYPAFFGTGVYVTFQMKMYGNF